MSNGTVMGFPLVPHKIGAEVMTAVFGAHADGCGHLGTAFNGLLVQDTEVAKALEDGAISVVPDLPSDATAEQVAEWEANNPKEYQWVVIDDSSEYLEDIISLMEFYDVVGCLDGKRVFLKGDWIRPSPRYLYFHFVMAQLKLIWRYQQNPTPAAMKPMLGTGWWVTRCQYLNPALLCVISSEIARITGEVPRDVFLPTVIDDTIRLGEAGLVAIVKMIQAQRTDREFDQEEGHESGLWDSEGIR